MTQVRKVLRRKKSTGTVDKILRTRRTTKKKKGSRPTVDRTLRRRRTSKKSPKIPTKKLFSLRSGVTDKGEVIPGTLKKLSNARRLAFFSSFRKAGSSDKALREAVKNRGFKSTRFGKGHKA